MLVKCSRYPSLLLNKCSINKTKWHSILASTTPHLGQPWDFTWVLIPMVGTSLKFWSLGWGTSLIYTTQPLGLHRKLFSRPSGARGGMVGAKIKYHITGWCYIGDTLRHLKCEGRILEKQFMDLFSFIFWRGTRFSYVESAYGCASAQKLISNFL